MKHALSPTEQIRAKAQARKDKIAQARQETEDRRNNAPKNNGSAQLAVALAATCYFG